jgi:hypothetical protein
MKTVKIAVENKEQLKRAQHAQRHLEEIAYALNGVIIEIEQGERFEFDAGDDNTYVPDYITLANFVRGE